MAGRSHWRVSIGIPGCFDIGIGGGFNWNTHDVQNSDFGGQVACNFARKPYNP